MKKRLFVGNLGTAVKGKHLKEKFSKFGDVENVELHTKNDESGRPFKKFAYLDMNISQEQLVDCIKDLNNLNWNGSDIIVQVAKESYIQRIQREAQGGAPVPAAPVSFWRALCLAPHCPSSAGAVGPLWARQHNQRAVM